MKTFTWKEAFEDAHAGATLGKSPYQNFVGYCYSTGRGVKQDHKKAAYWFKKAADNGSTEGMFNLALISESAVGTRRNLALAARLYLQACRPFAGTDESRGAVPRRVRGAERLRGSDSLAAQGCQERR